MTGVFGRGGLRAPWSFHGGAWGMLLPLAILLAVFWAVLRSSPKPEDHPSPLPITTLVPSFERLPPVLRGHYELWVALPEGGEERLATFTALESGALLSLGGEPVQTFLVGDLPPVGSTLFLTVEEASEPAIVRSDRVILQGILSTTEAVLEPVLPSLNGKHVALLVAPSDPKTPDTNGLWFATSGKEKGKPAPGLTLAPLRSGWMYGGFVTTASGQLLPTGTFRDPKGPDEQAPFSGQGKGLAVPGEDFVAHAPEGVTFPLDLADGRTTVTVGLLPDFAQEASESFLALLTARVPYKQKPATPFALAPVPAETFPRGVITFEQRRP